jgi:Bacterial Ig domain
VKNLVLPLILGYCVAPPLWANLQPDAVNDIVTNYGNAATFDALANDADPDGDALTVEVLSATCAPSLAAVVEDNGLIRVLPTSPSPRPFACTVSYRVSDGSLTDTATLSWPLDGWAIFSDGFESGSTGAWSETVAGAQEGEP